MNYKLTALLLIIGMLVIASEATIHYPTRRVGWGSRRRYGWISRRRYGHGYRPTGDEGLESVIDDVLNKLDENQETEE